LFGGYMFYRNKSFEVLIQGQGIIDITNLYLQVALHYGLIGLGLFFTILLAPLSVLTGRALRRAERAPAREVKNTEEDAASPEWRGAAGVVVGILAGWLFLVATTSDVGLTVHIGVVLAAMAQGLCDLSKARVVGPSANAWATPRLGPSNLPARGSISSRTTLLVERPDP
jgi:O-antigen ligase